MKIGAILFENYWQRKNIGGSRIRGHWLIKNIPDMELYCQGKQYDVLYFQKVYWKEMARAFKGIKILDICDPDWLDGVEIVGYLKEMDAVTVSTEKLKEDLEKFTDKPVYVIKDRIDFDTLPPPKNHNGKAKKVVWFGYSGNAEVLNPTLTKLRKLGLTLKVISEGMYQGSECTIENVKWNEETVNAEIQEADIALLPESLVGKGVYKSQNKTEMAKCLGLVVAKNPVELELYMDGTERQKAVDEWFASKEYADCNVKQSSEELLNIINGIKK
jgi:hypothetical protein